MLNPQGVLDYADIQFKVASLLGSDDTSMASDLIVYIFIAGIAFLAFLMLFILAYLFRSTFMPKLTKLKEKFMWNGTIRSIDVAFLKILFAACTQVQMIIGGETKSLEDVIIVIISMSVLIYIPIQITRIIRRGNLDTVEFEAQFSNLTD